MMRRHWESARGKIDAMSLRERALIFAAVAFILVSLIDTFLLQPLSSRQKAMSAELVQQQEKMREMQAQMQGLLQARSDAEHSPLRKRLDELRQRSQDQEGFLQSRRERMVEPAKMAGMLEQVLNRNGNLELVSLNTMPVEPLIEKPSQVGEAKPSAVADQTAEKQVFKHGVKITVRGSYADLMQYLSALERLPAQMFWGEASLSVEQYPAAALTLTLYTLSLDKTWLAI